MASDTAVTEFTEENAEQTGLSGVEKKKETDILLLQIKKRKHTEKTKVTKLRHELERVCLEDSELTAIESVIEQLWTALKMHRRLWRNWLRSMSRSEMKLEKKKPLKSRRVLKKKYGELLKLGKLS